MKVFKYIGDKILMLVQGFATALIILLSLFVTWLIGTAVVVLGGAVIIFCLLFFLIAGLFMPGDLQVVIGEIKNDE